MHRRSLPTSGNHPRPMSQHESEKPGMNQTGRRETVGHTQATNHDDRLRQAARNLKAYLTILREWAESEQQDDTNQQGLRMPTWLIDLDLRE